MSWFRKKKHVAPPSDFDTELVRLRALPMPTTTSGVESRFHTLKALAAVHDDDLTDSQMYDILAATEDLKVALQECEAVQ